MEAPTETNTDLAAEEANDIVASRLLQLRNARGYSRNKLQEATGIHWDVIRRLENGSRQISLDLLHKICAALDASPSAIISAEYSIPVA